MKKFLKDTWNRIKDLKISPVIIFLSTIMLIVFFMLISIRGCKKDNWFDFITSKEGIINTDKDRQINELTEKINKLEEENLIIEKRYFDTKKKINDLEKKKQLIKKPEGASETKDRFRNLGYNPK